MCKHELRQHLLTTAYGGRVDYCRTCIDVLLDNIVVKHRNFTVRRGGPQEYLDTVVIHDEDIAHATFRHPARAAVA